ncbi:DELLA PROTEIN RGA2-LIKE [Salix koriyanagi]|uniref:DELLA PROTEIN RGA2-LIKE n=1 Tax=Salix koriyanagi TaxID=2511006 RepID=A0A9Q0UPF4_9ROSI|nr:DELLA PROTEIN RGA2-LIKE [Salix koriyanagi]
MTTLLLNKLLDSAKTIEDGDLNLADSIFKEIKYLNDADTSTETRKLVRFYAEALVRRLYKLYPRNRTPLVPSTDTFYIRCWRFHPFVWFVERTSSMLRDMKRRLAWWRDQPHHLGFHPVRQWFNHTRGCLFSDMAQYIIEGKNGCPTSFRIRMETRTSSV